MSKISKYLFGIIIFFLVTSGAIHFALNLGAHITLFDLRFALILNLIFVFVSVVFCFLKGLKKSFGYLCFICTFSILILGQYFFGLFDKNIFGSFTFEATSTITYENELKSLYIILCSQLFVFLGYVALKDKNKEDNTIARKQCDSYYIKNIRFFSKIIMIFGFFPAFLKVILTIIFVAKNGYLSLYLANSNAYLNPILDLFDGFYIVGVFSYLATYPTKKDSIKALLVFAIFSFLTIFTGSRGQFVVNTIFIVWYLVKTDVLNISKKNKRRICFVGIPVAILLVSFL